MKQLKVKIWDTPLRFFHWLLAFSVTGAVITGNLGGSLTDWHERLGGLVLGLLVFRLIWGFLGSRHAQFKSFIPTPKQLSAYIQGQWQGVGHSPLGALAVLTLLGLLLFITLTGLFANDDIAFEGPLFKLIDKDLSDRLSGWHDSSINPLLVLLALHLGAIGFYQKIKKINLVLPMLTGKKDLPESLANHGIDKLNLYRVLIAVLGSGFVIWSVWLIK